MHFPEYWARGVWRGTDAQGEACTREASGWSDVSVDEARTRAEEKARRIVEQTGHQDRAAARSSYGYPDRPLREPVLRQLTTDPAILQAVITRNSYGCDVLNTDRVAFIDVDLPPPPSGGFFATLFGRKPSGEEARIRLEAEKIELLEKWQRGHPAWAFRVYRTSAGLRYLLVSALCQPEDAHFDDACAAVGADPDYRRLCRLQKSFRARLTPKPWRCGSPNPPHRFPFRDAKQTAAMNAWQAKYLQQSQPYAVCLFLLTVGTVAPIAAVQPILAEHDRLTRAESSLPLA